MTEELKPHQIAQLVNKLRDIATKYHAHGCLRELISREVNAALTQRPAAQEVDYSDQLTKAKRLLVDLHKIGGDRVRSMIEARTGSWFIWGQDRSLPAPQQATPEPVGFALAQAEFNRAIDFAIKEGIGAAIFLDAWRHGDTSEWPEFAAAQAKGVE